MIQDSKPIVNIALLGYGAHEQAESQWLLRVTRLD